MLQLGIVRAKSDLLPFSIVLVLLGVLRLSKSFQGRYMFKFILPSSTSFNLGVGLVVVQANNSGSGSGSRRPAFLLPLNWASLPFHYHYFLSLFRPPKIVVVEVQAGPIKW